MRVFQVHTRYRQAGGEDTVVENEGRLLVSAGHAVGKHLAQNPESASDAVAGLVRSPWNQQAARDAVGAAKEFNADVVHVHNTWFATSPAVFPGLKAAGFPVVATMHNYRLACLNAMLYREGSPCQDCVGRVPWRGVVRRCYRGSAAQSSAVAGTVLIHRRRHTWQKDVDVVIALTSFAADILVRSGVPAGSIEVKPNVVADPGERPVPPSESNRVLFVGRLAEEKGILDLASAWSAMTRGDLQLDVIGTGPVRSEIPAIPGLNVLGAKTSAEVAAAMLGARALVLPSRWYEGLPMVLVEALAAGLPVLVPNLGALPEIVGEGGLVFESANPSSLSDVLMSLHDDDAVDDHGRASRQEFLGRYEEKVGLSRLEEIYALARQRSS